MADLRVPEEFQVNQATLDFLKLHIENEVRNRLVKWIGLPFGGASLLAIIMGVFWYLPEKVSSFIQTSPKVDEMIHGAANVYLQPENDGGKFIAARLRNSVGDYLEGEEGKALVGKQIGDHVGKYLASEERSQALIAEYFASQDGRNAIAAVVRDELATPEMKALVRDSVDQALAPAIGVLTSQLKANSDRTIISAGDASVGVDREMPKAGFEDLQRFIREETASQQARPRAVNMTMTFGSGVQYSPHACEVYSRELAGAFGDRFLGTVVRDAERRFVAWVPPTAWQDPAMQEPAAELVYAVNGEDLEGVRRASLGVGPATTRAVVEDWTLAATLRNELWSGLGQEAPIAVVDDERRFRGVTSRRRLLDSIVAGE